MRLLKGILTPAKRPVGDQQLGPAAALIIAFAADRIGGADLCQLEGREGVAHLRQVVQRQDEPAANRGKLLRQALEVGTGEHGLAVVILTVP